MEVINYNIFINKIKDSQDKDFDLFELKRISWLLNFSDENVIVEDEENFFDIFSELLYYFDVEAQNDAFFKQVVDDILKISSKKKLDKKDLNYILNKNKILEVIDNYKKVKISKDLLINQLKKYFKNNNYQEIKNYLLEQKIEI